MRTHAFLALAAILSLAVSMSIASGAGPTVVSAAPADTVLFDSDIERTEALSNLDAPYFHASFGHYGALVNPGPEIVHRLTLHNGLWVTSTATDQDASITVKDEIVKLNPGGSPNDYVSNVTMSGLTNGTSYDLNFTETMRLWYRAETTGAAPPDSTHFWEIKYQRRPYYDNNDGTTPPPALLSASDSTTASEVWNGSWGGALVVDADNPDQYQGIRTFTAQGATDTTDVEHLLTGSPIADHHVEVDAHDFQGTRRTSLHSQFYNYAKFIEVVPSTP